MNLKIIFISFATSLSLLLLAGFFLCVDFTNSKKNIAKSAGLNFIISNEQDLTMLTTFCEEKPNPADVYLLIKISACDNTICIANIPNDITTVVETKRGNLKELFDWGGIQYVKKAIENIMNIEIDRTIQIDNDGLKEIIQYLNKYNINDEINGNDFYKLLRIDPVNAIVSLNNFFNSKLNITDFFYELITVASTTLSEYDFEIRKTGFEQMIFNSNCKVILPKLEFENMSGHNKLTENSKQNCYEIFGNVQKTVK